MAVALRQLNPSIKRGHKVFLKFFDRTITKIVLKPQLLRQQMKWNEMVKLVKMKLVWSYPPRKLAAFYCTLWGAVESHQNDQQKVCSFFILIFNQFTSNASKIHVLSFSLDWNLIINTLGCFLHEIFHQFWYNFSWLWALKKLLRIQ